jgi:hypothetical protein
LWRFVPFFKCLSGTCTVQSSTGQRFIRRKQETPAALWGNTLKPQITNHKSQTNHKKTINKKNKQQKDKTSSISKASARSARQPVFVLNFELLYFEFVCNLWFVIWDFPASQAFLVPARPGYVMNDE